MSAGPRVALSQDFLLKLGKLPSAVHANIAKWALKFQQNPKAPGINYEAIKAARDQNLYSVRIDQDWRGIVFHPPVGDLYILLHVDKHDPAYRWAERRKLAVNPATGAIQIVNLEVVETLPEPAPAVSPAPRARAHATPQSSPRPRFRACLRRTARADRHANRVDSAGANDRIRGRSRCGSSSAAGRGVRGLFLIAAGDSVTQVLVARESRVDRKVDPADFVAALEIAESQSRFVVVTDDAAMSAILNAPLQQWRVFLHPTQRKLAEGTRSGPVRVLGGAGTGKTVLAMHRAAWLARNHVAPGQKVLFTTFTKNLAFDIEHNLKSLMAGDPALERIEVRNLDRWVHAYLHRKKYPHSIVYGLQPELWKTALALAPGALGLDDAFYADEWSQVITAQGVQTLDDYRRATRTGRRTVLTRAKRDQIWPVFEEYRLQLSSQRRKDADDAFGDAAALLASEQEKPYAAIVVDETQDFGPQALKLLRAMVAPGPNDLFFVGDGHQRIYSRHRASMGKCGINIQGRSKKLYLNYRTTEEIRRTAVALLEGREIDDLDGGTDDNSRYKSLSHGPAPEVVDVATADAGVNLAVERVTEWVKEPEIAGGTICVMAPTKKLRDAVGEQLVSAGIAVSAIEVDAADTASADAVRVATMHRAKGLEFDRVVGLAPNGIEPAGGTDIAQLIYVSLTRAKTGAVFVR